MMKYTSHFKDLGRVKRDIDNNYCFKNQVDDRFGKVVSRTT